MLPDCHSILAAATVKRTLSNGRFAAALIVLALGLPPIASGARTAGIPIRPARPSDDAVLSKQGWAEEWRILAFSPARHGFLSISLVAGPIPMILITGRSGNETVAASATLPYGLLAHQGSGVTIANLPDNAPPQPNSLLYAGGNYVVDLTWPARGHLTIHPRRVGVTVGPWHLGGEPIVRGGPPTYVAGEMRWSVPVAVGTISGTIEADSHRITLAGWRAYHDHTWGRFKRSSSSWTHWDFAVESPHPGEAWILNGLEPTDGRYYALPSDKRWRGVLIHATPGSIETCNAQITRRGWESRYLNLTGSGWDYWLPTHVRANCRHNTLAIQPAARPWPFFGGFNGGVLASSPLPANDGWVEHAMPVVPTS
jgi:hypothetical protein